MQARLDGAFWQRNDLSNLWYGELFLIMQREKHGIGLRQLLQYASQGIAQDGSVHVHLYTYLFGYLFHLVMNNCELMAEMVFTEIIGNGIEPCAKVMPFTVILTNSIETQKRVVHEVGSKVAVFPQPSDEEPLQPPGMAVVEFFKGTIIAACRPLHQLFVGMSRHGF